MGCNCDKNNSHQSLTVQVFDDTGDRYDGILYTSLPDFANWFTSSVSEFHLEVNSNKILGESQKYSAHSLPMVGITKVTEENDETKNLTVNLKQGNTYAYLSSGRTWKLGVKGDIFVESHRGKNVS